MNTITDRTLLKRLTWFVGLWLAGVATVGTVASVLHWVLRAH